MPCGPPDSACFFCGETERVEIFEVWTDHTFMLDTCCAGLHEHVCEELARDPASVTRWLGPKLESATGYGVRRIVNDDGAAVLADYELRVEPIEQKRAKQFVRDHHQHNPPPAGDLFRAGIWNGPTLVGVVIVGRPTARLLPQQEWAEVTRLCLDRGLSDKLRYKAASLAYGWAAQEAERRGRSKIITYTLAEESGMSLRYARWSRDPHVSKGGSWDRPSRPREDKAPTGRKLRWFRDLRPREAVRAAPVDQAQGSFWSDLVRAEADGPAR